MAITIYPSAQASSEIQAMGSTGAHNLKVFKPTEGHPMSCGVFAINKADLRTFEYPCTEYGIVLEGELRYEEEGKPGETITLKPGDVVRVDKGAKVKWSTPSTGKCESLSLLTQTFMPKPLTLNLVIIVVFYVNDRDIPIDGDLKELIV